MANYTFLWGDTVKKTKIKRYILEALNILVFSFAMVGLLFGSFLLFLFGIYLNNNRVLFLGLIVFIVGTKFANIYWGLFDE